jgi:hypothetical protein
LPIEVGKDAKDPAATRGPARTFTTLLEDLNA